MDRNTGGSIPFEVIIKELNIKTCLSGRRYGQINVIESIARCDLPSDKFLALLLKIKGNNVLFKEICGLHPVNKICD